MHDISPIPAYLLCERFAHNAHILDLNAADPEGIRLLCDSAAAAYRVLPRGTPPLRDAPPNLVQLAADFGAWPFQAARFDLVLHLHLPFDAPHFDLDAELRACRALLSPTGLAVLRIPNRDAAEDAPAPAIPSLVALERALRHHFPHVLLYAQHPLFGATLSPLASRQSTDSPLFDDRLMHGDEDPPDAFLALCTARYLPLDDTLMAQLPFRPLSEQLRRQSDQLHTAQVLAQKEKHRSERAIATQLALRDEQLERKDIEMQDLQERLDEIRQRFGQTEDALFTAQRTIRRLEQQLETLEREAGFHARDRDEIEIERTRAVAQLHDFQAALKQQQREQGDLIEQIAARETENESLRQEAISLRRTLATTREEHRQLQLHTQGTQEAQAHLTAAQQQGDALRQRLDEAQGQLGENAQALAESRAQLAENAQVLAEVRAQLSDEKHHHEQARQAMQAAEQRATNLEADLRNAMASLAANEGDAELKASEIVHHLRREIERLKEENETELMCVREDLETELRHAFRQLEARQSEIWELREEVLRLQAQSVASAAASRQEGVNPALQHSLLEQETLIHSLTEEREKLRTLVENQKQSLEIRKKNLRILAALLKRERQTRNRDAIPSDVPIDPPVRTFDVEVDEVFDIASVMENENGQFSADFTFLEQHDLLPPRKNHQDDAVVEAIMESVVARHGDKPPGGRIDAAPKEPSAVHKKPIS
jgi:SAM-dependent methyltransferase